jgi:hypothetical protein
MFRPNFQLGVFTGAIALLAAALGCQFPGFERPELAGQQAAKQPPVVKPAAEPAPTPPAADAMTAAADEATIAAVMQEVQEIGSTNPDAQQALLAELHRSKPSMWPLIVQQFRATLAYHDQLMSKPAAAPERLSDLDEQMSVAPVVHSPAPPTIGEPPSAAFGKLGDPRNSRPDPAIERLFATASPANMPAPTDAAVTAFAASAPRAFAEDAAARPIEGRAARNEERVVLASATTSAAPSTHRDVQSALYSVESNPTRAGESREASAAAPDQRDWQQHLDLAIADLDRRLADGPHSTAEVHQLVSLRLLQLLAGRTEESLEAIPRISPKEQDYWSDQIFALATFLDHHTQPDDKRRAAASVTHLDDAVGHLRELGSLSLRNLTFCTKVHGYGSYEAIEQPRFAAGEQLSLYVEVENYHSESSEKGYATLLGASYELRDDSGRHVDSGEFPPVEDCCRSRRRDFHIQYGLMLPKTLKPGKYQLELAMKDRQSDKIGHASIDFEIRGL